MISLKVLEFHTVLRGVVVDGQSFEDFCHRIPVADITLAKKKRRRRRRRRKRQDQEDGTFPYNGTDPASGSGGMTVHGVFEPPIGQGLICSQETEYIAMLYDVCRF